MERKQNKTDLRVTQNHKHKHDYVGKKSQINRDVNNSVKLPPVESLSSLQQESQTVKRDKHLLNTLNYIL